MTSLLVVTRLNGVAEAVEKKDPEHALMAGAATSNITPMLGSSIIGGWNPHPAAHIHDELHVRCLALDNGEVRLAFAIVDSIAIPREVYDLARKMIGQQVGLLPDRILMAATHTHSATSARGLEDPRGLAGVKSEFPPISTSVDSRSLDNYQRFVAGRIADGIRRAVQNLEHAEIGWGVGTLANEVFNRRWHMKPGVELRNPFGGTDRVLMNPGVGNPDKDRPAGPVDPDVSFLYVRSLDGRPLALLANYSLHYVGGTRRGDISADYFGVFAHRIAQLLDADDLDPPFVGILTNGTSGDINNIDYRGIEKRERAPYAQMRHVAGQLATEIHEQLRRIDYQHRIPLEMQETELILKVRRPNSKEIARARGVLERDATVEPYHRQEVSYARRTLQMAEYPVTVPILLQAIRIGDLGIAAIPAEVFVEIGLEVKAKSPFDPTFTISLANDQWGYLPTPGQHELGGYETWLGTNRLEVKASTKIVESLLELFRRLRD
jgi:hypothetical protein